MAEYLEIKMDLIQELTQMNPHHKRGNNQYSVRCPMCGDSRKSARSTHFYVKINPYDDNEPVLCHCFLCNVGGLMTTSTLKHLDINDLDISSGVVALNNIAMSSGGRYKNYNKKKQYRVIRPLDNKNTELKRKYICDRIGVDLSIDELLGLKTVFSLGDFIVENNIETLTVSDNRAFTLDEKYVGFLTMNNNTINFRNVIPFKNAHRYTKYTIENMGGSDVKFYTIPTTIDILTSEHITINIAEGVFDILSIFYNVFNGQLKNTVYSAVTGSDYKSVIDYYLRDGFIGNVTLNLFMDSEVPLYSKYKKGDYAYWAKDIITRYSMWVSEINVHYNNIDEDFGVPRDRIELSSTKIYG